MSDTPMSREWRPALVVFGAMTLITGILYPLLVTGIAQTAFPVQANGSLIRRGDQVIGSALIGQSFKGTAWFQSRPSATSGFPYNGVPSGGSNLGPIHPDLIASLKARSVAIRLDNPEAPKLLPADLLTASGSGLDPHISPAAARLQVARVASARHLGEAVVRSLVDRHIEGRTFGILGEPRVNVLMLNLALDSLAPLPRVPQ